MKNNIKDKGFWALIVTQFLGAFNDNAFKFVIAVIAVDQFADQIGGTKYLSLSGAALIVPFLLFSTYAGFLADRFSKQQIIVRTKIAELVIMLAGLFALISGNIWMLLFVMFLMGSQSAFFSPSKYGILPEILSEDELSQGNGIIQLFTNAAIILGTAAAGILIEMTKPALHQTAYFFIAISIIGIITSLFVTKVPPSGSTRPIQWNIIGELIKNFKFIKQNRTIFLSMAGLVYFGFLGSLFQLNILLYAKKIMGLNDFSTSVLLITLVSGIGVGALLAGRFSEHKIELGLVPIGAIGLSIFSFTLGFIAHSPILVKVCLFLLGLSAGFYIVPLNALIQQQPKADQKGQILATNNFFSFSAMLIGAVMIYILRDFVHLNAAQIFIVVGLITTLATGYVCMILPYAMARFIFWILTHTVYKIRAVNPGNIPKEGGALLVSNHVSTVDAFLIMASLQRPVRFLMNRNVYHGKWIHPLCKLAKCIPVAFSDGPKELIKSLDLATQAIKDGELVCIFAEGQMTRTGNILKFQKGMSHIMKEVDCPVVPVHLDRVWGSIFSFEGGKYYWKMPKMLPYPVTVSVGQPMPSQSSSFEVRQAVSKLGAEAFPYRLVEKLTLPEAFHREARRHPKKMCLADTSGKKLNCGQTLISAVALSGQLKAKLGEQKNIGILIPPSVGGALTNVAVSILNKIPVNINYTTSEEAIASIIKQCDMKTIITSKIFLEKVGLNLSGDLIYIEDIVKSISTSDKLVAAIKSFVFPRVLSRQIIFGARKNRKMDDVATIMFTSGSTGEPKGVMLTHANVTSNLEGLYQVFHTQENDVMLGVLPLFHSFGFTATMWFPLIGGLGVVYHVNPLDAKMIGKLVQKHKVTILMSTPTFLNTYIKRCTEEQFKSLRLAVVGAEKLKENVAKAFEEKYGIVPMEGYGCTELSPIAAINLPDFSGEGRAQKAHKAGKIGMPLPGVAVKVVDQNDGNELGVDENGLMLVKGPNVMKGYLNREDKTKEVINDGWYVTGDIANIDEDGFITITDRVSRFSKIGGEMVPHIKIEEAIQSILNTSEQVCVVTSVPDEKKGEKLAVLCLRDIDVVSLVDELKNSDLPNLWVPDAKMFHYVDAIPLLGTGKTDLGKVKQIAQEVFGESNA